MADAATQFIGKTCANLGRELPRVLYAVALPAGAQFGSGEEYLCTLARRFEQQGSFFLPLFIAGAGQSGANFSEYISRGVKWDCLNLSRFEISTLLKLANLIRRHRIEIVHWNFVDPLKNPYVWGLTILCPHVRHWTTDHNSRRLPLAPQKGMKRAIKRWLVKRYDVVVCVSQYVHDCLKKQCLWPVMVTQYHFVNMERFAPDQMVRQQLRQSENVGDRLVALFVGYLISEKGVDVALHAMVETPPRVCLWIVGGGPEEHKIAALIERLGLGDRVRMFGPQTYVQNYMKAADLLLCPSIWGEAAGLVNLEAQACGIPVVASRIGGIPEHVIDDRTGLLFEAGNSKDLARQLRRLVDEPCLLQRLSSAARPWVMERFLPAARISETLNNYRTYGIRP